MALESGVLIRAPTLSRSCWFATTTVIDDFPTVADMRTLGERLKEAREEKQLSQSGLAKLAGVTQSTIGNLESGTRQNPRALLAIATALGVNAEWLSTGRGSKHPQARTQSINPLAARLGAMLDMVDGDRQQAIYADLLNRLAELLTTPDAHEADQPDPSPTPAPAVGSGKRRVSGH